MIVNESQSYNEDGVFVTGIPQRCVQGTWSSLCNDGSIPYYIAELVCFDNGYQGNNMSIDEYYNPFPRWYCHA